ncbi:MAG TPA: hypothetical protein VFM99_07250 [Chitinophagales bacterium]|nr:hypothetical protein [Chitinophagales bacterium]
MEKRNYKEYETVFFWKEEQDDVLFFKYAPKLEMDIEIAKKIVENRLEYTNNKPMYTVIDGSNLKSTTKEARDYMTNPDGGLKGILAGAFLANSVVTTVIINLYLTINKPPTPAKFFSNKQDALKWINEIREKNKIKSH